MKTYLVSYDLHAQRSYPPVWGFLQAMNGVRLLESLWLIRSARSSADIRDSLQQVMDADDSVVVLELPLGALWATARARDQGVAFLKSHVAQ